MSNESNIRNIIIATQQTDFAKDIKKHIEKRKYNVSEIIVVLEHLMETLDSLAHEGIIIHGIILDSELGKKNGEKRLEQLSDMLYGIREKYSELKIVLLANEKPGHPFLADVVQMGIYNIFLRGTDAITIDLFDEVLTKSKPFSFVSRYLEVTKENRWRDTKTMFENKIGDSEEKVPSEIVPPEPVEKIVIKEKIVEKVLVQEKVIQATTKLVGIISLTMKSGSSMLSMMLAKALANKGISVSVVDDPSYYDGRTYLYDAIGLRLHIKDYSSLQHIISQRSQEITKHNLPKQNYDGVNWYVTNSQLDFVELWQTEDTMELLRYMSTNITLLDLGYYDLNKAKEIIKYLDHVFFITAATPHEMEANSNRIKFYLDQEGMIQQDVVINYWDESMKRATKDIFELKNAITCPPLNTTEIFKHLFDGSNPYNSKLIQEQSINTLQAMAIKLVPEINLINKTKKKLFSRK